MMTEQDIFVKRTDGIPVTMDLPGKCFEVDVANNLLRPQDGSGDVIFLNALHDYFSLKRNSYLLFYNTTTCKVENPLRDGLSDNNINYAIIEVPRLSDVDPIGANIKNGVPASYGLMYRSLTMSYVPQIITLDEYSKAMKSRNQMTFPDVAHIPAKRELPIQNIAGTDFVVDIMKFELREKGNEQNVISFKDMTDLGQGYLFEYNWKTKNIPRINEHFDLLVEIPEFVRLDPEGVAQKYGLTVEEVKTKTDFDLMVDQHAFDMRLNGGRLPTIDIAGHLFYVDIRMDKLRPKDDFLSNGIVFADIDSYFSEEKNAYIIPYNPKTHEFQPPDYENLTAFPKDLIAVQFSSQRDLDPIGWNRQGGWNIKDELKTIGVRGHFTATTIPWKETFLREIIKENLERKLKHGLEAKLARKGRGRKM